MRMDLNATALTALLLCAPTVTSAQSVYQGRHYEVPAGPLGEALALFARQSGQQMLYSEALVQGRRSAGLSGTYDAGSALTRLLQDTGLSFRRTRPNVFVVFDPASRAEVPPTDDAVLLDEIVVTGSYLRGATSASPVTVLSREDLDRRGRATVADSLAALPQNFTGSAYEGSAGTGADRSFSNIGYATGLNLRGLGADATLVLVNGRRLAGTGIAGDFSDISTIPGSAVQRVDVLLDGASALYGPDVAEEILTNCGIEVVFAPKDVRIARELSDRLGFYTYAGRSLSRPKGLSPGRRSVTVSDQRRALMLPQELLQMPARDLIILKAGVPPVRGRKIRYYRDAAFRRRLRPPPIVPVAPSPRMVNAEAPSPFIVTETDMDLDAAVRTFTAEGCPPPPVGASEAQMVDWLDRVLGGSDGSAGGREP